MKNMPKTNYKQLLLQYNVLWGIFVPREVHIMLAMALVDAHRRGVCLRFYYGDTIEGNIDPFDNSVRRGYLDTTGGDVNALSVKLTPIAEVSELLNPTRIVLVQDADGKFLWKNWHVNIPGWEIRRTPAEDVVSGKPAYHIVVQGNDMKFYAPTKFEAEKWVKERGLKITL